MRRRKVPVSTHTNLFTHLAGSLVAIGIGLVFFMNGHSIGELTSGDSIGARGIPLFLSGLLLLLGVFDFCSTLLSHRSSELVFDSSGTLFATFILIGLVFYVYLLGSLGFLIATTLLCTIGFRLLAGSSMLMSVIKALGISAVFIVAFQLLLQTNLPEGPLGGLL